MFDVKVYLKSKRKPIILTFTSSRQKDELICSIETNKFVNVGCLSINADDISHIVFERAK